MADPSSVSFCGTIRTDTPEALIAFLTDRAVCASWRPAIRKPKTLMPKDNFPSINEACSGVVSIRNFSISFQLVEGSLVSILAILTEPPSLSKSISFESRLIVQAWLPKGAIFSPPYKLSSSAMPRAGCLPRMAIVLCSKLSSMFNLLSSIHVFPAIIRVNETKVD